MAAAAADGTGEGLPSWPAWTAPVALVVALVLATLGGIIVDIPALALGVKITGSRVPAGLTIADTFVQDVGFIAAAVFCGRLGARTVHSWQLGLRAPRMGFLRVLGIVAGVFLLFLVADFVWVTLVHPPEDKILEQLGGIVPLSAAITCVVAPIAEEILFRGYIFTALRNWRGTLPAALITGVLFGGVHVGSAPALDLVPLAALGFALCLIYRYTGSLYPCFALHALNNSYAFANLENFSVGGGVLLLVCSWGCIAALILLARRVGLISAPSPFVASGT